MAAGKVYYTAAEPQLEPIIRTDEPILGSTPRILLVGPDMGNAISLTGEMLGEVGGWQPIQWQDYSESYHGYVSDVGDYDLRNVGFYDGDTWYTITGVNYSDPCRYKFQQPYYFYWNDIVQSALIIPQIGDIIIQDKITGAEKPYLPTDRYYWSITGIDYQENPIRIYVDQIK